MTSEDLRALIDDLHQEIDALPTDADARARLSDLASRLEEKLGAEEEEEDHPDLGDRISEAIQSWEADHPKATALLNRISTLLSGSGV
jgi:hypothetical protein